MASKNVAIIMSRGEACTDGEWKDAVEKAQFELLALVGSDAKVAASTGASTSLIACGSFANYMGCRDESGILIVPTTTRAAMTHGDALEPTELANQYTKRQIERHLADAVPPFGYWLRDTRADRVSAATDSLGMRHLYWSRTGRIAMCSSSSTLLARLSQSTFDTASCAVYAKLGHFLGESTMFSGVTKLARGQLASLEGGEVVLTRGRMELPEVVRTDGHFTSLDEAVDVGCEVLLRVVGQSYLDFPDALLELSGGLDSRLILAAARRTEGKAALRTITIGENESGDMKVAAGIVQDLGLEGSFVPFSLLDQWGPQEVMVRIASAALSRDFASNAVSGAIHDFVSEQVPATAQITGAAGEQARGRYFAGQRARRDFDPGRVESLVRWQLVVNQAVHASLLSPDFQDQAQAELRAQAWQYFDDLSGSWPLVTDQIYMFGRMQRWAGPAYSHWSLERQVLAPFFHRDYVDWASRLPLSAKRTSRAFLAVLERLDEGLATRPLENGLTPRQMKSSTPMGTAIRLYRDGRRLQRKVRQRLARRRHVPSGVGMVSKLVAAHWRVNPPNTLESVDFLDHRGVEQFIEGRTELDPVSIAFLINLDGAAQVLGATEPV